MPSAEAQRGLLAAMVLLSIACIAPQASPQDAPAPAEEGAPGAPAEQGPKLPGFVFVPAGQVWPGCTDKEYVDRHRGNTDLKKELIYDVWGQLPPFLLPAFHIGKYEVTNAQWKLYLDSEFRVEHTTGKGETLKALAGQYVKFRGEAIPSEWVAIYALNWQAIVEGWQNMKVKDEATGQESPVWQAGWPIENPPAAPPNDIGVLELPEGLKLTFYKTRVPQHWYGWCRLAGLGVGREYCDPRKSPAEAFAIPEGEPFKSLALADTDFAAYPTRSASPNEILAFAEWAGCQLPTEYEWERAARGDNLRWAYPFGNWDHDRQRTVIAGAENERCRSGGPLRVDDESVTGSDSPFGARHMAGNIWELTRTFFDVHPKQVIEPPSPSDRANYALVAKGGSFGDRWQLLMVCARTGIIGVNGQLSLQGNNRADSLGLRLVRHADRPAYDLMLHSLRRLTYDSAAADWSAYLPHGFAMDRMAGTDDFRLAEVGAPYILATKRTSAIAFAPLWATTLDEAARRAKPERNRHYVLGALRCDVPLKAGVRLSDAEMRALQDERERYKKLVEAYKKLPPAKQKNVQLPQPPAVPDAYEIATEKNSAICGLFRENLVAPGEWFVVYWNGFIGLCNRTLTMPPDAILMVDGKQISRKSEQPGTASLTFGKDRIQLKFQVSEQPSDKTKQIIPPGQERSEEWAICEVMPSYFIKGGPSARPYCWDVEVAFPVASVDDPLWKGLSSGAVTGPTGEKKPEGKAETPDKTSAGR